MMHYKSIQAILAALFSGMLIFFLGLVIFQVRVGLKESNVVVDISTLTDDNFLQWGASPGRYNIPIKNTFQFFTQQTYNNGPDFQLMDQQYDYTYSFEYLKTVYIPSSAGYIEFVPSIEFKANFNESEVQSTIKQINLVAAYNFNKQMNLPDMVKVPTQLDIIIKTIYNDFLPLAFAQIIFQFYINDQATTYSTIFEFANLSQQQQDELWNDVNYGWGNVDTFTQWIRLGIFQETQVNDIIYQELKAYFDLNDQQMNSLIGPNSIIAQQISMIIQSASHQLQNTFLGECDQQICTLYELAQAQWGRGLFTEYQLILPIRLISGGYQSYNSSIPENSDEQTFEYFQNEDSVLFPEITFDLIKKITVREFEQQNSMFDLSTMRQVMNDLNNLDRIKISFEAVSDDEAQLISEYLQKIQNSLETPIEQTLSLEIWRYVTGMINDGQNLLRQGIHAKALYYQNLICSEVVNGFTFSDKLCQSQLDFTINPKNGMILVDAALLKNSYNSISFISIQSQLGCSQAELAIFLWDDQKSRFASSLKQIAIQISQKYKCQNVLSDACSARELFLQQFKSCDVTLNLPEELGFTESDRVCGIGQWDLTDQHNIFYELGSYLQHQNIINNISGQPDLLLSYELGGLMGYYSLNKIAKAVYRDIPLDSEFEFSQDEAKILLNYLINGMVNYQYGGQFVNTNPINYLWNYENKYTIKQQQLDPLQGGAQWKSNAVGLIEKKNSEYVETANLDDKFQMDTGIVNVNQVRQMKKSFGSRYLKSKQIYYRNTSNQFQSFQYNYPRNFNTQIEGSQGLGFAPQMESNDDLKVFDWNVYSTNELIYKDIVKVQGINCYRYIPKSNSYDMNNIQSYPIVITQGTPDVYCSITINNGKKCQDFLNNYKQTNEIKIDQSTGLVLSMTQTYFYWLNLKSNDILLDNINLKYQGMIPLAIRTVRYEYSQDNVNTILKPVQQTSQDRITNFIVFLVFAGLFTLAFAGALMYYCKNKANFVDDQEDPAVINEDQEDDGGH